MTQALAVNENKEAVIHQAEESNFLAMMERLAMSNIDVAKLEKMMDLHERMLDRNAKAAFAADYVRMKPNLPKIARSKDNTQTKSKYAPLEDINTTVDPVLEQFGFGTSTKVIGQTDKTVTVRAELWHRDGHVEATEITMPLDDRGMQGTVNKTLPHATSSSVTYAKRVAICALLNISTGDDKDGNAEIGFLETEKAAEIDTLMRQVGANREQFLAFMGVDDVRHIRANEYENAKKALKAKQKGKSA